MNLWSNNLVNLMNLNLTFSCKWSNITIYVFIEFNNFFLFNYYVHWTVKNLAILIIYVWHLILQCMCVWTCMQIHEYIVKYLSISISKMNYIKYY